MNKFIKTMIFFMVLSLSLDASEIDKKTLTSGEQVFRAYCWGCHHQTSMAFGPSFQEIANKRTKTQMMTHIMAPKSDYKELGYKRTVMPNFAETLNNKELDLIIDFIMAQKGNK